jgi:hypothetical protein
MNPNNQIPKTYYINNTNRPFIKFTSPELESLLPESGALPLHVLHLSKKSFNGLYLQGVRSVGGFVKLIKKGIGNTKGLGPGAHRNIAENITALSTAINRSGDLSLLKYTQELGYPIIPPGRLLGAGALMTDIDTVLKQAVEPQFGGEHWMLFQKHLLVAKGEQKTLDELGKTIGMTRQRIHQIVECAVQALSRSLLQGNYTGLHFRFTEEVSGFFQEAKFYFDSVGQDAWTEDAWRGDLVKTWGIPLSSVQPPIDFLIEVLGFSRRANKRPVKGSLVFRSSAGSKKANKTVEAVCAVYRILSEECTGVDSIGLVNRLVKKEGVSVTLEELPSLLSLCPFVETKGDDCFRHPFSLLNDRGDQIVRVLAELGRPAECEEIFRLVNIDASRPYSKLRAVSNSLGADSRIERISKSKHWALKEWGVETKRIEAVMTEILDRAGEPLSMEEIRDEMLNRHPLCLSPAWSSQDSCSSVG